MSELRESGLETPEVAPRTWRLAVASLAAAVLTWGLQAVAGRALGPGGYADFMVVWGLVFLIVGLQQGLQQEVTRSVATVAGRAGAAAPAGADRSLARVAVLVAAGGAAAIVATSPLWGRRLFGDPWLPIVLAAAAGFALYACYNVVNGAIAGLALWGDYSLSIAGEGVARFAVVAGVIALGAGLPGQSWALVAAGLTWVALLARRGVRRAVLAPVDRPVGAIVRGAGHAMVATTCSAILIAGFPVLLSVTSSGPLPAEAGIVLAAVVATRAPLLLPLNAFQAVILSRFVVAGPDLARQLLRLVALVAAVAAAGAAAATLVGPWLLRFLYGPQYAVSGTLVGLLVLGAGLLTIQTATGMAVIARGRHLLFAAGWVGATAVSVIILTLDVGVGTRTAAALLVGPAIGVALNALSLVPRPPR